MINCWIFLQSPAFGMLIQALSLLGDCDSKDIRIQQIKSLLDQAEVSTVAAYIGKTHGPYEALNLLEKECNEKNKQKKP